MLLKFKKLVVFVAVIILIGALIYMGYFLNYDYNFIQPPIISDCPDYWDISVNSNTPFCKNILKINNGDNTKDKCQSYPIFQFKQRGTGLYDIMCEKYKWAKECKLTWDGISSNNNICELSNIG